MRSTQHADYYRQKRDLHNKLEKQLREELRKLDAAKPQEPSPEELLKQEVEAILQRYNYTPAKMLSILACN